MGWDDEVSRPCHAFAAAAALTCVAMAAACTAEPQTWPARTVDGFDIPQITWPHGPPDTSNPWVEGLLDALIAKAAATNNHDMSPQGLHRYLTPSYLDSISYHPRQWVLFGTYEYYAGPVPFRVGDITLETPDRALVTACVGDPTDFDAVTEGRVGHFWLERGDDGRIRLRVDALGGSPCPLGNARAGYFDPQPDPTVIPSTMTMPDGTITTCDPELSKHGCPPGGEPRP